LAEYAVAATLLQVATTIDSRQNDPVNFDPLASNWAYNWLVLQMRLFNTSTTACPGRFAENTIVRRLLRDDGQPSAYSQHKNFRNRIRVSANAMSASLWCRWQFHYPTRQHPTSSVGRISAKHNTTKRDYRWVKAQRRLYSHL